MADETVNAAAPAPASAEQPSTAAPAKVENGATNEGEIVNSESSKKRTQTQVEENEERGVAKRVKGVAPIKAE